MVKISFVEQNGTKHDVEAEVGLSLMRAALNYDVPGIMADCGGECACATCHAYIDPAFFELIDPAAEEELDMLECAIDVRATSRLTCQVVLAPELDGMIIELPASQL